MYLHAPNFSSSLRQGDVLEGRAIAWPDLQVERLVELKELASGSAQGNLAIEGKVRNDHFMILSQCCDLEDKRILVAQLLPAAKVRWGSLDAAQQRAFKDNRLTVEDAPASLAEGSFEAPATLIYPGYFFLPAKVGVVPKDSVVAFSLARGLKQRDLRSLRKTGELVPLQRSRLRTRLAVFFARVPDEDREALQAEGSS